MAAAMFRSQTDQTMPRLMERAKTLFDAVRAVDLEARLRLRWPHQHSRWHWQKFRELRWRQQVAQSLGFDFARLDFLR